MKLSRAKCPVCGRDVALRKGGELREHWNRPVPYAAEHCRGEGLTVEDAKAMMFKSGRKA